MSQIQEVYSTLVEVDRLLSDIELKINNITQKTVGGGSGGDDLSIRQQIHTINILSMTIADLTGDKNIDKAVQKTQQFIAVLMRLRMLLFTIQELEAGTIGGPWGLLYAGANALAFGISLNTLGQ